mgnify:CR=1 FL=1
MRTATNLILACSLALFMGCPSSSDNNEAADATHVDSESADGDHGHSHGEGGHGHSHADADALTWAKEDLMHEGYEINLGLHGPDLHAGEEAEVAVEIKKDDAAVPDAKVFVTLLDEAGENELVEEQATVYEPETDEEEAHYAQAMLAIPADARRVMLRYRIEFPDAPEFTSDVLMKAH